MRSKLSIFGVMCSSVAAFGEYITKRTAGSVRSAAESADAASSLQNANGSSTADKVMLCSLQGETQD
jgi:hypothetical protein